MASAEEGSRTMAEEEKCGKAFDPERVPQRGTTSPEAQN